MTSRTLRLLEFERLRIGDRLPTVEGGQHVFSEAEFAALVRYDEGRRERAFDVGHRVLRFRNFVGFLQVGRLGIEILPKVDRERTNGVRRAQWRDRLLHMLRVAGRLPLRRSSAASLARERGTLLEVFVQLFLDEVDAITHAGLVRGYRADRSNRSSFSGRLVVREQLRQNLVHRERFFVERSVHDADQRPNHILRAGLDVLGRVPLAPTLEARRRGLLMRFEDLPPRPVKSADLDRVRVTRKTERYRTALTLAELLLRAQTPGPRAGELDVVGFLFDMNALWEAYVAAMLRRQAPRNVEVRTQSRGTFWKAPGHRRTLRPDIVLLDRTAERPILVLDTKWKRPTDGVPGDGDLKQMFAYNELLGTAEACLVYPAEREAQSSLSGAYLGGRHRARTVYLGVDGGGAEWGALWALPL